MSKTNNDKRRLNVFYFIVPFLLWLFLFRPYLSKDFTIPFEILRIYAIVKFYFNNLQIGVIPFWNPFSKWGIPMEMLFSYVGIFNPLWMFVFILSSIGLTFYSSFLCVIIFYFFIGLIGFYCLAWRLLKNSLVAYVAFLLLLFSSLSIQIFSQIHIPLIYIPAVWFFYFLVSFFQRQTRHALVGMTFTLMIIFSQYLPFYFLTVLLFLTAFFFIIYPREAKGFLQNSFKFFSGHFKITLVCFIALVASFIQPLQAYHSLLVHEIVAPSRYAGEGVQIRGTAFEKYEQLVDGGVSARMSLGDLFPKCDQIEYPNDGLFYVSIFAYFVLVMGAFLQINKRIILLSFLSLALFLLSIENVTPFHKFLYQHVFYFRLFRNMHFFLPFILSTFILLIAEQFKLLWESKGQLFRSRWVRHALPVISLVSLGLLLFLVKSDIKFSYLPLLLVFPFFYLLFSYSKKISQSLLLVLLFLSVTLQPIEFLWHCNRKNIRGDAEIKDMITVPFTQHNFSYSRPSYIKKTDFNGCNYHAEWRAFISMSDSPGFLGFCDGFPSHWSFYATKNISQEVLEQYTKHKFVLYDNIALFDDKNIDSQAITDTYLNNVNLALIAKDGLSESEKQEVSHFATGKENNAEQRAMIIDGPNQRLETIYFDANSLKIKTNFETEKFLVYNDSFNGDWQAFVNGKKTPLYRANIAFKGIRLPAGSNEVYWKYQPLGGEFFYLLMHVIYLVMFVALIVSYRNSALAKNG